MTKHLLDISSDYSTLCGMDTRGLTFQYDLGKSGHDNLIDLDDFPLKRLGDEIAYMKALDSVDCEYCQERMQP